MSDEQFSVDDILNEYSKKKGEKTKSQSDFDLDEFLTSSDVKIKTENADKESDVNSSDKEVQSGQLFPNFIPREKTFQTSPIFLKKAEEAAETPVAVIAEKPVEVKQEAAEKPVEVIKEIEEPKETAEKVTEETTDFDFDLIKLIMPATAKKPVPPPKKKPIDDDIKAHSFGNNSAAQTESKPVKAIRKSSGNTEIIEGLLKLKREKVFSRTTDITPINRKKIDDIDLDIQSKIIPKTEQIPIPSNVSDDTKIQKLFERRNKKIKDFVLASDADEPDNLINNSEADSDEIDDFDKFEDAPIILKEIIQLKGTLIVRFCFLLIASLLSAYITIANDFNWPLIGIMDIKSQPSSFLFINIVLGLLSAFVSYTVITGGIRNFYRFNADADSLCAFALISSLVSAAVILVNPNLFQQHQINTYISIAIAALLFNTLGKLFIVNRTERNFKFVSGDSEKYALFQVEDENTATKFTKGALRDFPSLSSMKKTEFINDFLRTSYSADMSDAYSKFSVPITVLVALITTLISVFLNRTLDITSTIFIAFATFAGTISLCSSFSIMFVVNFPLAKASKKYLQSSACMIGYSAIEEFSETNSVLVDMSTLFPDGMVDLVNLKQMSSTTIEEGILVAASLTCHAGSILKSTFYKMLRGKTEMLYPVESYIYEDTLGLSGWIDNKRILLGNRELMINHSIEGLPSKEKEAEYSKGCSIVLYLSISGEITTMFLVQLKANTGVTRWIQELQQQNITIVLRSVDSIISLYSLSQLFDVPPDCFKLIPFRYHKSFDEETTYVPSISSSMVCSGKFHAFSMLITGAKRLHKTAAIGISFIVAASFLGIVLAVVMTLLSAFNQITPSLILIYNFSWLVFTLLVQAFRKT